MARRDEVRAFFGWGARERCRHVDGFAIVPARCGHFVEPGAACACRRAAAPRPWRGLTRPSFGIRPGALGGSARPVLPARRAREPHAPALAEERLAGVCVVIALLPCHAEDRRGACARRRRVNAAPDEVVSSP